MTELSFLVELLLHHKLPKPTRELVAQRIKEVEEGLGSRPSAPAPPRPVAVHNPHAQAPSTMAALARHPDLMEKLAPIGAEPAPDVEPVAVVAQTPAAIAAMQSRNAAISASLAGRVNKATGRPRKF